MVGTTQIHPQILRKNPTFVSAVLSASAATTTTAAANNSRPGIKSPGRHSPWARLDHPAETAETGRQRDGPRRGLAALEDGAVVIDEDEGLKTFRFGDRRRELLLDRATAGYHVDLARREEFSKRGGEVPAEAALAVVDCDLHGRRWR